MGDFLNLVYDDIDVTKVQITNYMDAYAQLENYKVFHINDIHEDDGEKYYYFFEYRYYLTSYIVNEKKLPFTEMVLILLREESILNILQIWLLKISLI